MCPAAAVSAVNHLENCMRLITISFALLCMSSLAASADPADKAVGIGVGVGIATGPNLQVMTSRYSHVDVGMGYELDDRLRLQADHDWRLVSFVSTPSVHIPLYLGLGAYVSDQRFGPTDGGLRMPLGVQADFAHAPIQLFSELAPELALFQIQDRTMMAPPPEVLAVTGLVGVRAGF
jgi:hypothetical protein